MNTSSANKSLKEEETLKECDLYVSKHNIKEMLKECIVQLCLKKPDNPIPYLKQYFEKLEKVKKIEKESFI
jgi:cAMP-dependent protein kinase regulator